jgi:hypothetical protein
MLGITGTLRWRLGGPHPALRRSTACTATSRCSSSCCWRPRRAPRSSTRSPTCASSIAVVPLASHYRPLWLDFGALALDLLVAVIVTSAVRARLGLRAWRAVHWAAYAVLAGGRAARPGHRDRSRSSVWLQL